jgi:hypothetical protein
MSKTATKKSIENLKYEAVEIFLDKGDVYDCSYVSRAGRISRPPVVEITVAYGEVIVKYQDDSYPLAADTAGLYYSNLRPIIECLEPAEIGLKIYDEAF